MNWTLRGRGAEKSQLGAVIGAANCHLPLLLTAISHCRLLQPTKNAIVSRPMDRKLYILYLTVFIDLLGFGIVIPLSLIHI